MLIRFHLSADTDACQLGHLRVLLPNVGEEVVDELAHKVTRMVNSCY